MNVVNDLSFLSLITGATIMQVSILLVLIVKNLNPSESHPPLKKLWSLYECRK